MMSHHSQQVLILLLLLLVTFCTAGSAAGSPLAAQPADLKPITSIAAPKKPCKEYGILVEKKCVSRAPATPRCIKYHTTQAKVCTRKQEKCIKFEEEEINHTKSNTPQHIPSQQKCAEYSTICKRFKYVPDKTCLVHETSCKEQGEVKRTVLLGHKFVKCNRHIAIEKPVCESFEKICVHEKNKKNTVSVLTSASGNQEVLSTAALSSQKHDHNCPCTHWKIQKTRGAAPICKVHAELIKIGKRKCTKREPIKGCKQYKQVKNANGKLVFETRTVQKCVKFDTSHKKCVLKVKELKQITSAPGALTANKFEQVSRCLKYKAKKTCLVKKMVKQKICKEKSNKIIGQKCVAWTYGQVTRTKLCTLYSVPFTRKCVKRNCKSVGTAEDKLKINSSSSSSSNTAVCSHGGIVKTACTRIGVRRVELKSSKKNSACLEPQFEAISKTFTEPVCKKQSQICVQYSVKLKKKCTKKIKQCKKYKKQKKHTQEIKHKSEKQVEQKVVKSPVVVLANASSHKKCKEKVEECVEYKIEKQKTCKEYEKIDNNSSSKRKGKCLQFKDVEKKICIDKKVTKKKKTTSKPVPITNKATAAPEILTK